MQPPSVSSADAFASSILLVDDDPDSAFLLRRDLLKAFPGAEVRVVPSRSILQLVSSATPALLVTCYRLRGLTGPELITQLRRIARRIPIVVVSGMPIYRDQALLAGADLFLTYDEVPSAAADLQRLLRPMSPLQRDPSPQRSRAVAS